MKSISPGWLGGGTTASGGSGGSTSGGTGGTLGGAVATRAQQVAGTNQYEFTWTALAASQLVLQGSRTVGRFGIQAPWAGSIIGLSFMGSVVKTAGVATFTVYLGGTATAATMYWTSFAQNDAVTFTPGSIPFYAKELIDVRVTTSADFTPAPDVSVLVYTSTS